MFRRASFYGTLFVVLLGFALVGCGGGHKKQSASNPAATANGASQSKPQADQKAALDEINKILDLDIVKKENADRTTIYRPIAEFGGYPSWQVIQNGNTARMDAVIMDGTKWEKAKKDDNYIYWYTVIFSTDEKKWEYNIPNCNGSTGGGKETASNAKGTYELYKTAFGNLAPGYRLLVEGANPSIRLRGANKRKDIKVSKEMIAAMKAGLRLDELFISTRGKIERAQ